MATTITNGAVVDMAQKSVTLLSGLADSLKAVSTGFGDGASYGDIVKVPVVAFGANSTEADYQTDGGNSITLVNVTLNAYTKQQWTLTEADFAKFSSIVTPTSYNALVSKAAKGVSDAVYGLANTTNFDYDTNKIVTGKAESALAMADIYAAVGAAVATGIYNPDSIKVVCPWSTYSRLRSELDKQFSDKINMPFELVPNLVASTTYIVDGSWAGVAFGADPGVNKQAFVDDVTGLGYSLKVFHDDKLDKVVVAPRFLYGVSLLGGPLRWLQSA